MAPATRSSTPSTPAKTRVSTTSNGLVTPPSSSTRRPPHCTKCHRPRAGHPRSGCPYVDAPNATPASLSATEAPSRTAKLARAADDEISEEFSSLHIVSPTEEKRRTSMPRSALRRRLSVRFALVPEQTLASLSSTDVRLVEQLLQPGMISDVVSPQDRVAHVLEWRKSLDGADSSSSKEEPADVQMVLLSNNTIPPLSRTMPCTLLTPTPSQTTTEPATDHGIGGSALDVNQTVYLLPDHDHDGVKKTKPLSRSMSMEQRSLFLEQLGHSSSTAPATLVSIPLADLDNVQGEAEKLGFRVRVLPSGEENHKWIVLGTEEEAIIFLAEKFLEEEKRSKRDKGRGGKLTAVAGGVVFGAVATWTGLAFS